MVTPAGAEQQLEKQGHRWSGSVTSVRAAHVLDLGTLQIDWSVMSYGLNLASVHNQTAPTPAPSPPRRPAPAALRVPPPELSRIRSCISKSLSATKFEATSWRPAQPGASNPVAMACQLPASTFYGPGARAPFQITGRHCSVGSQTEGRR
jgi:hypothetical protein